MNMQPLTAPTPAEIKTALRAHMAERRDAATPEQRAAWSEAVCRHIIELPSYQSATVLHCFLSIRSELDTRPIIEHALAHGKRVAIPVFKRNRDETASCEIDTLADDAYKISGFGLRIPLVSRPVDSSSIDLVLVPLLAFAPVDVNQTQATGWLRLGYGAGYYDRLLSRVRAQKIGLAFDLQIGSASPREPHDILLDAVITETGAHMSDFY
ncbi:MAG: 5-formyltetrahydrofolate cyclo-ligase [Chloroflexi bacterium]|nr:5-formyltetrahydrofolate cyclo-ligase [Chloroflexota bacterium]